MDQDLANFLLVLHALNYGNVDVRANSEAAGGFEEIKKLFELHHSLATRIQENTGNQSLADLEMNSELFEAFTISIVMLDNIMHITRQTGLQKESKELHWSFYDTAKAIMDYCVVQGWPTHPTIGPLWNEKYKVKTVENFVTFMAKEPDLILKHVGGMIRTFGRAKVIRAWLL